jgi:hypothetical protein
MKDATCYPETSVHSKNCTVLYFKIQEVNLRPTVSRPVCLGVSRPSGTRDQFFSLLEISFRQLRVCYFVAPSLTRGRVIYYKIASGPCQNSNSWDEVQQNSRPYFTVSFETPPTWRARFPYLYPPGTEWPSYTHGHWVPFLASTLLYSLFSAKSSTCCMCFETACI